MKNGTAGKQKHHKGHQYALKNEQREERTKTI